jgi:RHS repeat-associated protein
VLGGTELLSQTRDGVTSYYLHDGQTSIRDLTDPSGAVTNSYDYSAYGELLSQTGSAANAYLYTGQQFDSETGLYSLRARYYDPGVGKLLSNDKLGYNLADPSEGNRYAYVSNNPINEIDPSGHQALTEYSELNEAEGEESAGLESLGEEFVSDSEALLEEVESLKAHGPAARPAMRES